MLLSQISSELDDYFFDVISVTIATCLWVIISWFHRMHNDFNAEAKHSVLCCRDSTRINSSYATGILARYASNPSPQHTAYGYHVLRYIAWILDK